jgi:hypothetical protein
VDRIPEFIDNLGQSINFIETHFALFLISETEFQHDIAVTVGYNQHVVSEHVGSFTARICDCLNE